MITALPSDTDPLSSLPVRPAASADAVGGAFERLLDTVNQTAAEANDATVRMIEGEAKDARARASLWERARTRDRPCRSDGTAAGSP